MWAGTIVCCYNRHDPMLNEIDSIELAMRLAHNCCGYCLKYPCYRLWQQTLYMLHCEFRIQVRKLCLLNKPSNKTGTDKRGSAVY